jgi:iron(III) transport system permease protein
MNTAITAGATSRSPGLDRSVGFWLAVGIISFLLLPWYGLDRGLFDLRWLTRGWPIAGDGASGLFAGISRPWLLPLLAFLLLPLATWGKERSDPMRAHILMFAGLGGLAWLLAQGFAIGLNGWQAEWLAALFGPLETRQFGMGYGALFTAAAFLFYFTNGLAARGAVNGDSFVVGSIGFVIAVVGIFIFFPIFRMFAAGLQGDDGSYSLALFVGKFLDYKIWSLACLSGGSRCGVAWNSLFLAVMVGVFSTALGLVFALMVTRTGFRHGKWLRAMTLLPIITPPFVIGLAIILLFGLSGIVTTTVADWTGSQPTRWIYGFAGVFIAQLLAFTPIAFLVLIGVVEGVSPSMEEAAQTLRAGKWHTFWTVSLPLMRPGLANAFLLGFIESMADFGNPLVLSGNFDVLSTEIFFAIVGAQNDSGRAAVLALVLLFFTLIAFYLQRFWLGRRSYTTLTGKGDSGQHPHLPHWFSLTLYAIAGTWTLFTLIVYFIIIYGSFVEVWGLKNNLTFEHYIRAFEITWNEYGLHFKGGAWDSFWTTITISAVSAPLTAAIGLLTAYLLVRQRFAGKDAFEFTTMLSFAVPGTVIGVSYIIAFNVPPIELTGTGLILVLSFIFRNMPVGVRAGVASMSQLDKSLDEASLTLGANSWQTFQKIVLPLLRPAILAALVYSFVRAMTAISAVIFLVSAKYDMATSYIIGRVENNDYGLAIAYSTVLIFVMFAVIGLFQFLVGKRQLGRRLDQSRTNLAVGG